MSYSLRNTILLATVLFLIIVTSGSWLWFTYARPLAENRELMEAQRSEMSTINVDAAVYDQMYNQRESLRDKIANYPKTLFPDSRLSELYDYVRRADRGMVFMNFTFTDSVRHDSYGTIRFAVDGFADYRNLRDFIYTLEDAAPIIKVNGLNVRPTVNPDNLHEVGFRLTATAYYSRKGERVPVQYASAVQVQPRSVNPFFPVVHPIAQNKENLTDVSQSRLVGISGERIYLYDQAGRLIQLRVGDRVYSGRLERISHEMQEAVFFLNKGGITEYKTLRIAP